MATDKEHIRKVIEIWVGKNKRIPRPSDLLSLLDGLNASQVQGHILAYTKTLTKLTVLPNGMVVNDSNKPVWYRNSAGSLLLARFKEEEALGSTISG